MEYTKEDFKKTAKEHLFVLERPKNEKGEILIEIYGFDKLYEALNMHVVSSTFGCSFVLDPTTSSATKCICGKDKWEHNQAT